MTTEPVTSPPVSAGYSKRSSMVVGASGSLSGIRSSQTCRPCSGPSWFWSEDRNSALRASLPPPAPKIDPMNAVVAMTSLTVAGAWSMSLASQ